MFSYSIDDALLEQFSLRLSVDAYVSVSVYLKADGHISTVDEFDHVLLCSALCAQVGPCDSPWPCWLVERGLLRQMSKIV